MKGKKETNARRTMEKENFAKFWESTTKVMNTVRGTITAKAVRKEEKKEKKDK